MLSPPREGVSAKRPRRPLVAQTTPAYHPRASRVSRRTMSGSANPRACVSRRLAGWLAAASCLLACQAAAGQGLEGLIPSNSMAAYIGRPMPNPLIGTTPSTLIRWLGVASDSGVVPQPMRLYVDLTGFLPLLGRHPHAVILLDATSQRAGPNSYRLEALQLALLIESQEDTTFVQQIGKLITHHTDAAKAQLLDCRDGDLRWRRLQDHRLPQWAVFEWGRIGPCLVLTLGEGAYQRVVGAYRGQSESLVTEDWFPAASRATRSQSALLSVYVGLERIRDRLSEVTQERPAEVARAMGVDELERVLWTAGFKQRALFLLARYGWQGGDLDVPYADPDSFDPNHVRVVPERATAYTVITLRKELTEIVDQFVAGYLAAQRPERAERLRARWSELEQTVRLNIRRDLLDQLGRHIIIHNYPHHPLGWPIACTVLVEIKAARSVTVRRTVDAFLSRCQARWAEQRGEDGAVGWRRTPEGYWVLKTGVEWLSIGVANGYVIIGWSPQVVRLNARHLARLAREAHLP